MNELKGSAALERQEIAMRVANFRATQEKFQREREEYFVSTLKDARRGKTHNSFQRDPFWS